MRITAHFSLWASLVFAALCIAYGLVGFNSLDVDATAALRDESRGFALFWLFLGAIGLVCAAGSWWLLRGSPKASDD